jgi:hypothetical protein
MTDPHKIFKRLRSDNEAERTVAANKLYESFKNGGGHPDDWELYRKGTAPKPNPSLDEVRVRMAEHEAKIAEACHQAEEMRRRHAEVDAARDRKAREKADAENAKLREQLDKAKEEAKTSRGPNERVDLLSGLLSQERLDKLSPEQISERMETLFGERERRQYNLTGQIDLVIGQLTDALYQRHAALFGKRKRISNGPTISEFLEGHAGKSASWCRRCYKAYIIVTADDWDQGSWDGTGGIEGIIKVAADPNKPTVKRISKVRQRLDALADVVRRKEWESAERLVNAWDSALP